jgi:hypothetical protein
MQKFTLVVCSLCAIVAVGIGFSSCKDEEPFVKPNLSVKTESITVAESGGTVQVEFVLDRGAPGDITIEYELRGTATSPADYSVTGTEGEVAIANGQTSGIVTIQIVSDAVYEGDETIEVSIEDVSSDDVLITNNDETEIKITDDDPQITVSMATAAVTINEDTEELAVEVKLSAASSQAITVGYTFTGDALEASVGDAEEIPSQYWDYGIDAENPGELVIPAGSTTVAIPLVIGTDFLWEDKEDIIITLTDVSSGAQLSASKITTVTLEQQDGTVLGLLWADGNTDVDMDLFLWNTEPDPDVIVAYSANPSTTTELEFLFIPSIIEEASLGASYIYYQGTASPMNFIARFAKFTDGVLEPNANFRNFNASYTTANINKWDTNGGPKIIEQTFDLVAGQVTNISTPITVPTTSSRLSTVPLPDNIRRMKTKVPSLAKRLGYQ